MGIKLSIITVNRNNGYGLKKTIDSVLEQSFSDLEYIIIDGASTDNSLDVLKSYGDKVGYWISEPDKGIYNAMNKGVLKAKGEYIQFCNSGDWFVNSEVLANVFWEDPKEDIIFGNLIKVIDGIHKVDKGIGTSDVTFYHLYLGTINHPATFARRDLFSKYGLFSERYECVGDWEWLVRTVGLANTTIKYIDRDIINFDFGGISNVTDYYESERKPALIELIPQRILEDYKQLFLDEELFKLIKKYKFSRFVFKVALKYAKLREKN